MLFKVTKCEHWTCTVLAVTQFLLFYFSVNAESKYITQCVNIVHVFVKTHTRKETKT